MRCLAKPKIHAASFAYPSLALIHAVSGEMNRAPFRKDRVPVTLSSILGLFVVLLLSSPGLVLSETHAVNATIDASKTGAPISKNIYGQFLEHGGDIVNTGVWSEMLVDRKFFYPVAASAPTPPPVIGGAGGNPRFRRTPTRWWAPIGGGNVVTMDTRTPYTGDHSPLVKLDVKDPHGFSQSGIAVRKEQGLHRTHRARRLSRRNGQGDAHLGQGAH